KVPRSGIGPAHSIRHLLSDRLEISYVPLPRNLRLVVGELQPPHRRFVRRGNAPLPKCDLADPTISVIGELSRLDVVTHRAPGFDDTTTILQILRDLTAWCDLF